jgi:hypothetical protein
VVATHADEALGLLEDPTRDEKELLGAWGYSTNDTWLHHDVGPAPAAAGRGRRGTTSSTTVSAPRLPGEPELPHEPSPGARRAARLRRDLNPSRPPRPGTRHRRLTYTHPTFSPEAVAPAAARRAQRPAPHLLRRRLPAVRVPRGRAVVRGARRVPPRRPVARMSSRRRCTSAPSGIAGDGRPRTPSGTGPTTCCSTSTSSPRSTARCAASVTTAARSRAFRDTDHLGAQDEPVRAKLERWLASQGLELPAGPVRVLTNLRVFGHVFNPVSWWYCYHPTAAGAGRRRGEQHLRRDARVRARRPPTRPPATRSRPRPPRSSTSRRSCRSTACGTASRSRPPGAGRRAHRRGRRRRPRVRRDPGRSSPAADDSPTSRGCCSAPAGDVAHGPADPPAGAAPVASRVPFHRKPVPPPDGFDQPPGHPSRARDATDRSATS